MQRPFVTGIALLGAAVLGWSPAPAQSLAARVAAAPDGVVRMTFSQGPGVCGDGRELIGRRDGEGNLSTFWGSLEVLQRTDPERACVPGPVRVALVRRGGRVTAVRTRVGGDAGSGGTDLGRVGPGDAAAFFLALADRTEDEGLARDALTPAILSDVDTLWRGLVRTARTARSPGVRQMATHELGYWVLETHPVRRDPEAATRQALLLKKGTPEPRVDTWLRVATSDPDPIRRREALRLLGKSGDPRAVDLFERLLDRATRPPRS